MPSASDRLGRAMDKYGRTEVVTIISAGKPTDQMSLGNAVRTIATIPNKLARSSCTIVRESGAPLILLAEIMARYERGDFPR